MEPLKQANFKRQSPDSLSDSTKRKWNKLTIMSLSIMVIWILFSFSSELIEPLVLPSASIGFKNRFFLAVFVIIPSFACLTSLISLTQYDKTKEKGKLLSIIIFLVTLPFALLLILALLLMMFGTGDSFN